ncbi:MAG: co-chaperone GroES [Patescibacteria group bacterium]
MKKLKLQPLGDKIILKPIKEENKTKSGIVLPDTVEKEKPEKAEVIACGPGKMLESGKRQDMPVKVGNKVIFKKYGPDEIKIEGEEYLIASVEDILAIIK